MGGTKQWGPPGTVLEQGLFHLFINVLDLLVSSVLARFVDGTKLSKRMETKDDCEELQMISIN